MWEGESCDGCCHEDLARLGVNAAPRLSHSLVQKGQSWSLAVPLAAFQPRAGRWTWVGCVQRRKAPEQGSGLQGDILSDSWKNARWEGHQRKLWVKHRRQCCICIAHSLCQPCPLTPRGALERAAPELQGAEDAIPCVSAGLVSTSSQPAASWGGAISSLTGLLNSEPLPMRALAKRG